MRKCCVTLGHTATLPIIDQIAQLRDNKSLGKIYREGRKKYFDLVKFGGDEKECFMEFAVFLFARGVQALVLSKRNWRSVKTKQSWIYDPYEAVKYAGKAIGEDQQEEFARVVRRHIPKIA